MSTGLPPSNPNKPYHPLDGSDSEPIKGEEVQRSDPFAKMDTEDKFLLINENINALFTAFQKKTGEHTKVFHGATTKTSASDKQIAEQIDYIDKIAKSIPKSDLTSKEQIQFDRINTAIIALKVMMLSPEEQLALSLEGISSGKAAGLLLVEHEQFAKGAAKSVRQVYIKIPLADRDEKLIIAKDNILVLPQPGLQYYIRKNEIETELETAASLTDELNLPKNQDPIHELKLNQLCKAAHCDKGMPPVLSGYKSVKEFITAFHDDTLPEVTDDESAKLISFCRNPQNSLILATIQDESPHISLDLKRSNPQGIFDETHPLVAKRGQDLEMQIREPLTLQQRAKICYDMIDGLDKLHRLGKTKGMDGYVHGDPKPGNILVYEMIINGKKYYYADIADLGKTRVVPNFNMGSEMKDVYWGNSRFRCSEMFLSQKGDVQGYGFMLIRTLEEGCSTNGEPLYTSAHGTEGSNPNNRRMFEKFLILNPVCTQREIKNVFNSITDYSGRFASAAPTVVPDPEQTRLATEEFHKYVHELTETMKLMEESGSSDPDRLAAIADLEILLNKMTDADPIKRITAEEALKEFPMALLKLSGEVPKHVKNIMEELADTEVGKRASHET